MLGSSMFDNDPFFAGHQEHMRHVNQLFSDSFGGMMNSRMMALPDASRRDRRRQQQQAQNMQVAERNNAFIDPFSHFDSMFSNMRSMMSDMHRAFEHGGGTTSSPDAHVFQQSSFMSYSNTGNGAPKVYQASSSSKQAPGGIREVQKTVRDSETGLEKIAVGHHIKDRGHVVERMRNTKTGEANQNQELINLEEDDVPTFDREYQDKWQSRMRGVDHRRRVERSRHAPVNDTHRTRHVALPESESTRHVRKTSHRRE